MTTHKPSDPWCDCDACRAMTPYQIRQAWEVAVQNEAHALQQLAKANHNRCMDCGSTLITDCARCGAPVCCPSCCQLAVSNAKRELAESQNAEMRREIEYSLPVCTPHASDRKNHGIPDECPVCRCHMLAADLEQARSQEKYAKRQLAAATERADKAERDHGREMELSNRLQAERNSALTPASVKARVEAVERPRIVCLCGSCRFKEI